MIDTIKAEIDRLKALQNDKLNYLQQAKNAVVNTEAELNQIAGAIAICEKLVTPTEPSEYE